METKQDDVNSVKYYKLSNGTIFKYDKISKTFSYLKNKKWFFYAPLISIYLDPSSEYDEITLEEVESEIYGRTMK